jgi:two-component system, cell cycle sensor histidine kinase PleC
MSRARARTSRKAETSLGEQEDPVKGREALSRAVLAALLCFTLVFGAVILVKLQMEWSAAQREAEGAQARSAAFLAERVSGRIAEARGALSYASADLESPGDRGDRFAWERIEGLTLSPYISGVALLMPGEPPVIAGDAPADLTAAADAALSAPGGIAALSEAVPLIAIAEPVRAPDGGVGALVGLVDPGLLLPDASARQVAVLTDQNGNALAVQPVAAIHGPTPAAERFGLDSGRVQTIANSGGGAMAGAQLGEAERTLGVAPLTGAPLQAWTLGRAAIDQGAWMRTLLFHGLLFLAPLFTAIALYVLLLMQVGKLSSTEAQLSDSEKRFRMAIEGARCGVWDWDLEIDEVFMTDSFAHMLGRPEAARLTGHDFLNLLEGEDRSRIRAALRGASRAEEVDVEVRAQSLPVWLQMRGRPLPDPGRPGGQRIMGVAIDITERKGAQARVAAAESRLRAALESMTGSFALWDSRGRLIMWNRKFREFFGLDDGQLKAGANYEAVEAMAAAAVKEVHSPESTQDSYEIELADGKWLHYSERTTADGGLVSVGADITALKLQEAALIDNERHLRQTVEDLRLSEERIRELAQNYEQEKIRAEEANRSKSEFLANMSHELRTPLNAIIGFSEMMAKEIFGPVGHERYSEYAGDIHNSGEHLLSLINDILDMSKIEAGKMSLQPEPLMPGELVRQCIRLISARADEKRITVRMEGEELPEIEADPRALKQVVLNLLSNAVKFTPEGGKVVVRGFEAKDGIVLQVADTGIGIAADDLPRLGRPFEQIESQHAKSYQGSGLGLALSKSLIEMHGGTLRIDSALGKGTTVSFTLPARAEAMLDKPGREGPDDDGSGGGAYFDAA